MSVTALMIAYNEEELLPNCLAYLESVKQITEIVLVVDQDTNDRTVSIFDRYCKWSSKNSLISQISQRTSIGALQNISVDLATKDWLLILAPDETFTPQLDNLLDELITNKHPSINAVRVPTVTLFRDRRHFVSQAKTGLDPHIRIFRKGFARFEEKLHADIVDINGRKLHSCYDSDILTTFQDTRYQDVGMKHLQLLKSDAALVSKGLRWKATNALKESAEQGLPVGEKTWLEWKKWIFREHEILDLPEKLYDITSDW